MSEPLETPPIGAGRKPIHTGLAPLDLDVQAGRALSPALRGLVRREVARALYVLLRTEEANVVTMSQDEFTAFCERILSEEE